MEITSFCRRREEPANTETLSRIARQIWVIWQTLTHSCTFYWYSRRRFHHKDRLLCSLSCKNINLHHLDKNWLASFTIKNEQKFLFAFCGLLPPVLHLVVPWSRRLFVPLKEHATHKIKIFIFQFNSLQLHELFWFLRFPTFQLR